jgi:hypothetical protein
MRFFQNVVVTHHTVQINYYIILYLLAHQSGKSPTPSRSRNNKMLDVPYQRNRQCTKYLWQVESQAGRQAEALLYAEKIRGTSQVKKVDSTTGYFLGNSTAV